MKKTVFDVDNGKDTDGDNYGIHVDDDDIDGDSCVATFGLPRLAYFLLASPKTQEK